MKQIPNIIRNSVDHSITLSVKNPNCSLIWLHGLGDSAQGFLSYFCHSHSPLYEGVRIKLLQAPLRKVTINNGALANSWYDIRSLNRFTQDQNKVFDFQQIHHSSNIIKDHVDEEALFWQKNDPDLAMNPYHKVFVGGFSQGGVISLHYALQTAESKIPAGVMSLSGYMLKSTLRKNYNRFPICLMHGQKDDVIKQVEAKKSYQPILGESAIIQYHKINELKHTISLGQFSIMKQWLKQVNQMLRVHYKSDKVSSKLKQKQVQNDTVIRHQ